MTSDDQIIIELINSKFEMINGQLVQLKKDVDELKAEARDVKHDIQLNSARINDLHSFLSAGFTIIAVVITLVGIATVLAPMFRKMYIDRKQERKQRADYVTRSEMEEAIAKALSIRR